MQYLATDNTKYTESLQELADLGLTLGPSNLHGQGVFSVTTHAGHDDQGVMHTNLQQEQPPEWLRHAQACRPDR